MADWELLLEAERRGILPQDKADLLAEARSRGLVAGEAKAPAAPRSSIFSDIAEGIQRGSMNTLMLPVNLATGLYGAARYGIPADIERIRKEGLPGVGRMATEAGENIFRTLPATVGMAMGSTVGQPVAGAAVGQSLQEITAGIENYLRGKPVDVTGGISRAIEATAGTALPGAIPNIAAPFRGSITAGGRKLLELGEKAGFRPSPADIRPAPLYRRIEATTSKTFGGGAIEKKAAGEVKAVLGEKEGIAGYARTEAERVGGSRAETPSVAGQTLKDSLEEYASRIEGASVRERERFLEGKGVEPDGGYVRGVATQEGLKVTKQAHKVEQDILFDSVESYATGAPDFTLNAVSEAAADMMKKGAQFESLIQRGQTSARQVSTGGRMTREGAFVTEREVMPASEGWVQAIANLKGRRVPFEEAKVLKERLGALYGQDEKWGHMLGALKDDLSVYAASNSERAVAYQKAVDFTRENVVPFKPNQPLGRMLAKGEPAAVFNEIFRPGDKGLSSLKAVHGQTGGSGSAWEAVKAEALDRAVSDRKFYERLGPETRQLVFSESEQAAVKALHDMPTPRQGVIKDYLRKDPAQVVPALLRRGSASYDDITALKGIVGGTPAWTDLQTEALHRLLDKPAQIRGVDMRSLGQLLEPEQLSLVKEIDMWAQTSRAGQRVGGGEFRPTGVNTASVAQAGGILLQVGESAGRAIAKGSTIVMAPWVVAKMVTNPTVAKWFSEGFRVPAGTVESARIVNLILPQYLAAENQR